MDSTERYEHARRLIKNNRLREAREALVPIIYEDKAADWVQKIDALLADTIGNKETVTTGPRTLSWSTTGAVALLTALLAFAAGLVVGGYVLGSDSSASSEPVQVAVVTATWPPSTDTPTPSITPIPTETPHPTATATASVTLPPTRDTNDIFDAQLAQLLEKGALLGAMTSQGVNYVNFGRQLVEFKGTYALASTTWPPDFAPGARQQFDKAIEGWDLALHLWGLKIDEADNPCEPYINGYPLYIDYAGDELFISVHPANFIVEEYRGKKYVPWENIGILFSLASDYFEAAQTQLLLEWP